MVGFDDFSPVKRALSSARSVLVALPQLPDDDKLAGGLALFLACKKAGRETTVVCQKEMTVGFSFLVGVDQVKKEPPGKNLQISFDYVEEAIEKVSYNIEGGKFNLVIQPRQGVAPLPSNKVAYSYSGGQADLIFVIGSHSLAHLGQVYDKNKEVFGKEKIVNLDNGEGNAQFGKINLVNPKAACCSELVGKLLTSLELPLDVDIASNLFFGLKKATNNFSSPRVGADTFEVAAFCLRAGARKSVSPPPAKREKKLGLEPMPTEVSASRLPEPAISQPQPGPSPDWFEPKIYQGSSRV